MSWEIWVEGKGHKNTHRLTGNVVVCTDRVCRQLGATNSMPLSQTLSGSDDMPLTACLRG